MGWGAGINFFSLIMTLPSGRQGTARQELGLAVDLWISRTEASFS